MLHEVDIMIESAVSGEFPRPVSLDLIEKKLKNSIKWSENDLTVYAALKKVCSDFIGKKYNKRFLDALKKEIGGNRFTLSSDRWGYGDTIQYYLKIRTRGSWFNNFIIHLDVDGRVADYTYRRAVNFDSTPHGKEAKVDIAFNRLKLDKKNINRCKSFANKINKVIDSISKLDVELRASGFDNIVTFDIRGDIFQF